MKLISVDVEADGPCPGKYSMVCFGAVVVDEKLDKTFYGRTAPISDHFISDALAGSGFNRVQHLKFQNPTNTMVQFQEWLKSVSDESGHVVFISDNPAFDYQFINYYFHVFVGSNPFGHSARRIGDIYCGIKMNMGKNKEWKKLRKTKHTHNPVDDAMGNAEALLEMSKMGLVGIKKD